MSARQQVTITLGRSGQVHFLSSVSSSCCPSLPNEEILSIMAHKRKIYIRFNYWIWTNGHYTYKVVKRARTTSDVSSSDYAPYLEGKRSVRERLGSNLDGQHLHENQYRKRQRTSNYDSSNNHMTDERQLMSNVRFSRDDLRYKLLSKGQSRSVVDFDGQNGVDLREKLSRSSRISLRNEPRKNMIEPRALTISRGIPPTRSADDLLRLDSSRNSYPSLTVDGLRHRSPDRLLGASRHLSPRRSYDEVRNNPSVRPYDDSRPAVYITRRIPDTSRPATFMNKTVVPVDASKSSLGALPGIVQKSSYMPEVPLTVGGLLHSLGLGKYSINFQAEEVLAAVGRLTWQRSGKWETVT
ncbi:uncharacterized protein LOC110095204 isoform X2 [Dendrobium catenatum]|uniref:uncharacterized protein LOC110095204 isoform X2 n=1 Tax=Dendrobium catenatum TaxID=906689 RepID=UPI0010A00C0F|nr:uncharacterized protein LOC110095204 isoform X2 [Dendrobium catenatum]